MNSRQEPDGEADRRRAPETSVDAFYSGRFHLVQPRRTGYRSGLDALLLAATVGEGAIGELLDIGSGAGAVGFAAATRAPDLRVALIESQPVMASCARAGLDEGRNAGFADRVSVVETDLFSLKPRELHAARGVRLADFVVTNPPFYLPGQRPSPDPIRAAALSAPSADFLMRWMEASLALLKDGGRFASVLPPAALAVCLPVLSGRIGGPAITPIHGHPGEAARRLILSGRKGYRDSLTFLPAHFLFDPGGGKTDFSHRISEGLIHIGWPQPSGSRTNSV
ncbi:methyltransferase [Fulvimarina sp. MAC3]|uniref:tRNA1(Val) (adenine(37)-N6)-methyltransferase n=1 Tax=Fulvimarina sp. MAC3 TaxID=3148887 RepID=UPI0031FDC882